MGCGPIVTQASGDSALAWLKKPVLTAIQRQAGIREKVLAILVIRCRIKELVITFPVAPESMDLSTGRR